MRRFLYAAVLLLVTAGAAAAQLPATVDPGSAERSREDLERLIEYYEQVVATAPSEATRSEARAAINRIRRRLTVGDFRLGDRILLEVRGEPDLPDTLLVEPGPMVTLPVFGEIPLEGVLRSEVEAHLTEQLGRIIRDPVVRARGLMRVSVQGAVTSPGYYLVPAELLVGETLMVAGGTLETSALNKIRIERGAEVVLEGDELQEAIRQGYTLDQLDLEAGDQIYVPTRGAGFLQTVALIAGIVAAGSFLLIN